MHALYRAINGAVNPCCAVWQVRHSLRTFRALSASPPDPSPASSVVRNHVQEIEQGTDVEPISVEKPPPSIDPMAQVAPSAAIGFGSKLERFVEVGENCFLESKVKLMRNVLVNDHTHIGSRTTVFPNAILGYPPQDRKYAGGPTRLLIGTDCVLREGSRVESGTELGGGITRLGNSVLIMAGVYVGHDSFIDDGVVVANNSSVAGHCHLQTGCVIGGHAAIHQHVRVGCRAMVGGMTALRRDVLPYTVVSGSPPVLRGLNYRQLWPALGFSHRRAALSMYHYLFPSSKTAEHLRTLPFPRISQNASLQDRFCALSDVGVKELVESHRRTTRRHSRGPTDRVHGADNADDIDVVQTDLVRNVFRQMSEFALESVKRRGLHVS